MHTCYGESWLKLAVVFFLFSSVFALSGPSAAAAGKDLEVSLLEQKIKEIKPEGLVLSFLAKVENRSERSYFVSSYRYRVLVNQKEYFTQNVSLENEGLEIKPGEKTVLNFPVRLSYQYLKPYLTEGQKQASCTVAGEMFLVSEKKKVEKLPFEWKMSFPIFKLPEVRFYPLQIKDLTLGGADFQFVFSLVNDNPYEVLIQDMTLELGLAGKVIFRGKIAGDKTLNIGQEKTFQIPLMLDFFEQGRELREELEKEKPEFRWKAQLTADSAWGVLSFELEKVGTVEKQFKR